MKFPCQEMRVCKKCNQEKLVALHFTYSRDKYECKECHAIYQKKLKHKRGVDPRKAWGFFNLAYTKRKDPRDTILSK